MIIASGCCFAGEKKSSGIANIDNALACNVTATEFFTPLIQGELLNIKPYSVDSSISFFKPKLFKRITAFGMPVVSVFGYAKDQVMFIKTDARTEEIYGVIVKESIANVQAQLNAVGATKAKINRVDSSSTSITCL